jgi:hypothetical protein
LQVWLAALHEPLQHWLSMTQLVPKKPHPGPPASNTPASTGGPASKQLVS